ncbi:hypothetical protein [Butyrivibrio sp.]|uniref:hypothetical protein n=1 Tax=Butyrivibrio sp. TaxID=28121 RepID=UPI0025B85BE5|nr:hypothetical protein [Butyrivibrio sp.]MBQ9305833.1 hypothetical protein [Butyrivibrio sp.]
MIGGGAAAAKADKIIGFEDSLKKKQDIEEWLRCEIERQYGETSEFVMDNPIIRICALFDALGDDAKYILFMYAARIMAEQDRDFGLREKFWHILEQGRKDPKLWQKVEKYAMVLAKENCIHK